MSHNDTVLSFVRENAGLCDDCIATQLGIKPRQSVNIATRALTDADAIVRVAQECSRCKRQKIVNLPTTGLPSHHDSGTAMLTPRTESPAVAVRRGALPVLDGAKSLRRLLDHAGSSIAQAIAEETVFLHPDTVKQTAGEPVFPIVRAPLNTPRGRVVGWENGRAITWVTGRKWWADDNSPPTWAFLWAARRKKGPDVQFNHLWAGKSAPGLYTALWNLCATPAFLAKTTDTLPEVKALLQYRSFMLYGFLPPHQPAPHQPDGYSKLTWAPFPDAVPNLEATYRAAMHAAPKNRTTIAARELGWLFSGWQPDTSLAG